MLEFGENKEGDGLPSKGESLKQILQTVKETVIRMAFVWVVCSKSESLEKE